VNSREQITTFIFGVIIKGISQIQLRKSTNYRDLLNGLVRRKRLHFSVLELSSKAKVLIAKGGYRDC